MCRLEDGAQRVLNRSFAQIYKNSTLNPERTLNVITLRKDPLRILRWLYQNMPQDLILANPLPRMLANPLPPSPSLMLHMSCVSPTGVGGVHHRGGDSLIACRPDFLRKLRRPEPAALIQVLASRFFGLKVLRRDCTYQRSTIRCRSSSILSTCIPSRNHCRCSQDSTHCTCSF